jgi:hypothetical protein
MLARNLFISDTLLERYIPRYDVDAEFDPVVMDEGLSFVPVEKGPVLVPLVEASKFDVDEMIVKLILFAAKEEFVADSVESAIERAKTTFSLDRDLMVSRILTGGSVPEGAETLPSGDSFYMGAAILKSDLIPKDVIVAVADPEFTGYVVRRGKEAGLLFSNKNAVMRFRIVPN